MIIRTGRMSLRVAGWFDNDRFAFCVEGIREYFDVPKTAKAIYLTFRTERPFVPSVKASAVVLGGHLLVEGIEMFDDGDENKRESPKYKNVRHLYVTCEYEE